MMSEQCRLQAVSFWNCAVVLRVVGMRGSGNSHTDNEDEVYPAKALRIVELSSVVTCFRVQIPACHVLCIP